MADCFGPYLAGIPFSVFSLYASLPALWPVLGDRGCFEYYLRGDPLVSGKVVYPLGIFLGNGFVVGYR